MDFLDQIPLDQTALTLAMVAIVVLFALVAIIKGIIKTIITLVSLALAAAAFLFGYLGSPPYVKQFIPEAAGWMPLVAGAVCALLALVIIQLILGIFSGKTKLTGGDSEGKSGRKKGPLAPLFGLLVGLVVLYGAITALRYFGTEAELSYLQTYVEKGAEEAGKIPLIVKAKRWLDDSPIATFHEKIDLLNTPEYRSRLNLSKLLIVSGDRSDLATALQDKENQEVFSVPEINDLANTAGDLRDFFAKGEFEKVYNDPRFERLITRPSSQRELLKFDLESFFPEEEAKKSPDKK
jgi:uncharacterized membrane protein required for colicin V production